MPNRPAATISRCVARPARGAHRGVDRRGAERPGQLAEAVGISSSQVDRLAGHVVLVRRDAAAGVVGADPDAVQLRDLLPQGHPGQQVGDAVGRRRAGHASARWSGPVKARRIRVAISAAGRTRPRRRCMCASRSAISSCVARDRRAARRVTTGERVVERRVERRARQLRREVRGVGVGAGEVGVPGARGHEPEGQVHELDLDARPQAQAVGLGAVGELAPDRVVVGRFGVVEDQRRAGERLDRDRARASWPARR